MRKLLSALAIVTAGLLGAAAADASITVNFSFAGNTSFPGNVTGHLVFDGAGTGIAATGVYIDSATAAINPPVDGYQNYNFLTGGTAYNNSFTVTALGAITSANLYVYSTHTYANVARNYIELNAFNGYNAFEQDYTSNFNGVTFRAIENVGGLAGATYAAPAAAAVPEPAAWAMMVLGFGVAGTALRRQRRVRAGVAFAG